MEVYFYEKSENYRNKGGVNVAIVLIRTIIVFVCIVGAMRLMGKRQLGQLELSELVVAVLISDMAAHPLQDIGIPLLNGLLPIALLLCGELCISWLSLKSTKLRLLLFGKPSILIRRGVIDQKEMKKNRFSLDELCEELRSQGITDLSQVENAVLETDGTLSVLLFPEWLPATAKQLGIAAEERGLPVTLISDGKVETENLRMLGKDRAWLERELKRRGLRSPDEVYYMNVDALGGIYLAGKEPS